MDRVEALAQALRALQVQRRPWEPSGGPEYSRFIEELFSPSVLYELCDIYLDPSTSPEQRQSIRMLAHNDQAISGRLFAFIGTLTRQLKSTGDARWLNYALATASIEDLQLDSRDTTVLLGRLYITADRAGTDPVPHFRYVASISSEDKGRSAALSTSELLRDFHRSAYFLSSVEPYLLPGS